MHPQSTTADIAVVGDGIIGSVLAFWLAHDGWRVRHLCEPDAKAQSSPLAIALGLQAKQTLTAAGLWTRLPTAEPFFMIEALDATGEKLCFDSRDICQPALGWIMAHSKLVDALRREAAGAKLHRTCKRFTTIDPEKGEINFADGSSITASLIIAADGPGSAIRELAGIKTDSHDYGQSALVCTLNNSAPRIGTARQWFLPQGPLALLPLPENGKECMIWSLATEQAEQLATLEDKRFNQEIAAATNTNAALELLGSRSLYPLQKQHATAYAKGRIVLVGDSAHRPHPLAGIGANLGFMDASCLHKLLHEARRRRRNPGTVGAAFNRRRRWHNGIVLNAIDLIQALYDGRSGMLCRLRAMGIRGINSCPPAKRVLARHAVGDAGKGAHQWYTARP